MAEPEEEFSPLLSDKGCEPDTANCGNRTELLLELLATLPLGSAAEHHHEEEEEEEETGNGVKTAEDMAMAPAFPNPLTPLYRHPAILVVWAGQERKKPYPVQLQGSDKRDEITMKKPWMNDARSMDGVHSFYLTWQVTHPY